MSWSLSLEHHNRAKFWWLVNILPDLIFLDYCSKLATSWSCCPFHFSRCSHAVKHLKKRIDHLADADVQRSLFLEIVSLWAVWVGWSAIFSKGTSTSSLATSKMPNKEISHSWRASNYVMLICCTNSLFLEDGISSFPNSTSWLWDGVHSLMKFLSGWVLMPVLWVALWMRSDADGVVIPLITFNPHVHCWLNHSLRRLRELFAIDWSGNTVFYAWQLYSGWLMWPTIF